MLIVRISCIGKCSQQEKEDEFRRRQLRLTSSAISKIDQSINAAGMRIRLKIKARKNNLVGLLADETLQKFKEASETIESDIENDLSDPQLERDLCNIIEEYQESMQNVENDAAKFNKEISQLAEKFNKVSVNNKVDLSLFRSGAEGLGKIVGNVSKDMVLKIAHFFGHKFKPWGATKATGVFKTLGTCLQSVGVAVDAVSLVLDKKHQKEMEEWRTNLSNSFNKIDSDIMPQLESVKNDENSTYKSLAKIQRNLQEKNTQQAQRNEHKKELLNRLSDLK